MLLSAGCSGRPESRAVAVNPCGWKSVEEREVSFVNSDTVSLRELSVFAGCDSLPLEITVHTPDSLLFIERVVLPFGTDAAEGTVRQRTFRSHGVLRREGTYRFAVSHTSGTPVRGLRAVGIEITETEHGKR